MIPGFPSFAWCRPVIQLARHIKRDSLTILFRAGCEQHDADSDEAEASPDEVPSVGFPAIEEHSPYERDYQEGGSVCSIDAPKRSIFLESMDDSIREQDTCAEKAKRPGAICSKPLPDKPAAADLGKTSGGEEYECPGNLGCQFGLPLARSIRRMRPAFV
jgi:hypothetical protein